MVLSKPISFTHKNKIKMWFLTLSSKKANQDFIEIVNENIEVSEQTKF